MITGHATTLTTYLRGRRWEPLATLVARLGTMTSDEAMAASPLRVEIDGTPVVGAVDRYTPFLSDSWPRFESHRAMIDLQVVVAGRERIDIVDTASASLVLDTPYDTERDMQFYRSADSRIEGAASPPLEPADATCLFLVPHLWGLFLPHDAHRPKMAADHDATSVTKVVFKIPVSLWVAANRGTE